MPERYAASPRYNIAPGQDATVLVGGSERLLRWGLLAPWRGHGGKRGPMIHDAPQGAIAATPVLRRALGRRCLVPADGFFAWRTRVPYWIHPRERVYFAGIRATHEDDGRESFAIVTVPASTLVAPFTPTMPMVVDAAWLAAPTDPLALDGWRADAVSTWVNDLAHDDARCIAPLGNPAQGELF